MAHTIKTRRSSAKSEAELGFFFFFFNKAGDSEILENGSKASCHLSHGLRESSQADAISMGGTQPNGPEIPPHFSPTGRMVDCFNADRRKQ